MLSSKAFLGVLGATGLGVKSELINGGGGGGIGTFSIGGGGGGGGIGAYSKGKIGVIKRRLKKSEN